jgi:Domain of Unknown Function (DUF748)
VAVKRLAIVALAVVVAAVVTVVAFRAWDRSVEDQLGRWATGEVARRTGGVYRLQLGDVSFLPLAGSISFDSALIATDTAANGRRETPLPTLDWGARGCSVSGLDLIGLLLRRRLAARELGCERVIARVVLPPRAREEERSAADSAPAARMKELARPLGLSSIRIAAIALPAVSLTLKRPGREDGTTLVLEKARFEAKSLVFEPGSDPAERPRLSADQARLHATTLVLRRDSLTEIAIAGLDAGLSDSTLRLAAAKHEPAIPEDEWVSRVKVRRDRIRFELDSLRARGVAYRDFVTAGDVRIRALELEGARLDVLSDKRIPRGPPSRHRTPQQVAAAPGLGLRLDSIAISRGSIVYREREPKRKRAGTVTFDSVRATILDLHLPAGERPLKIWARTRLMNAGVLSAEATVPLDAPDFRYQLAGRLGSMPAAAFNRFLTQNESFEFESGRVVSITFRQTARRGRATTTMTPRYHDLSVETPGDGGGLVGEVKEFIADALVVRSRNPDEDGDNLRTARTVRRYDPAQSWPQFLWFNLRDGLNKVLKE